MSQPEELVPENGSGVQTNTESEAVFETAQAARQFFDIAKERLLRINGWKELAGIASAGFQLTDSDGKDIFRTPEEGDFFKIDIPGPRTITGEGHDWVQIEAVEVSGDAAAIRVRPASNPRNEREDVAHFFSDEATSSFMVKLEDNKVIAGVYGRNEKPNTKTEKLVDTVRNAAIATGAITGFSKLQWKSLVNGIVKKD